MIKISVIVPVYNVENYLEECIKSIINQTFKNFELILVDDGSTDKSGNICDEFAKVDNRIKVIHKKNGGLSDARNKGISLSKGEYIVFIDSDDYIHPQLLEITYRESQNHDADLVVYNYKKIDEDTSYDVIDKKVINSYDIEKYNNIEGINQLFGDKYGEFNAGCMKLYKRDLFKKIKFPVNKLYEDALIAHEILYNSSKIIYMPLKLYYYRTRNGSIVNSKFNYKKLDFVESCYNAMKFYEKLDLNIKYESQKRYVYYFFNYYNKSKQELDDWKFRTKKIKKDFIKSLKVLLFSPVFKKKEKISWLIFILMPKVYTVYFDKRKESLNNGK